MQTLDYPTLKNDLNDFVLSGTEEFKSVYIGLDDDEVTISAYKEDDCYEFYCHSGLICTDSAESSHVSLSFIGDVIRKHAKYRG